MFYHSTFRFSFRSTLLENILKKSWNTCIEKSINAFFSQTPDSDSDDSSNNDGMPALVDAVSEGDSID